MNDAGKSSILCFGDSITEGIGACPMDTMSFPAQLQRMLGERYTVLNMGASGMTLQKEGDYPYYKDLRYEQSFSCRPDIVIIMIGTNDSKLQNRNKDRYRAELCEIIERFLGLDTHPRVIIASCCAAFSDIDTINDTFLAGDLRSAQSEAAALYGLQFADVYAYTEHHPEWFCDGIHPANSGYEKLARFFYDIISGTSE